MNQTYLFTIFSKHDLVYGFDRGLNLPLHLASENPIEVESSFSQVVHHARTIERECIKTYKGSGKRPYQ